MEASIDHTSCNETATEERLSDWVLSDIRSHWHWVRPALEEIIGEGLFVDLIPEDVYAACKSEDAHFWLSDDGFVVTTVTIEAYTGVRSLLLWFSYARQRGDAVGVKHCAFFEQVARDIGAKYLETKTASLKLAEYLQGKVGWELELLTLKKDVRHV
jgi:hypothetical protein